MILIDQKDHQRLERLKRLQRLKRVTAPWDLAIRNSIWNTHFFEKN